MGCREVVFHATAGYALVEHLFRERTECAGVLRRRDDTKLAAVADRLARLHLSVVTESGEALLVTGFTVLDYRSELPEEPLTLEFYGMEREQFERLFPGHFPADADHKRRRG